MIFTHQVKDNLARLLATENLIVEHKQVSTASFDVQERVLTLPMWRKASTIVYDLLVGHEVGHALYTPNLDWHVDEYADVPPSFVNVVEDARIERMMKIKFPGFAKTFYKGYKELFDDDFFSIANEDLSKLNFIDRINIHFKVGTFAAVPFSDTEQDFVRMVETAKTFDDVLEISKLIFNFIKSKQQEKVDVTPEVSNQQQSSNGSTVEVKPSEADQDALPGDSEGHSEASDGAADDSEYSGISSAGEKNDEFDSKTDSAFERNQEQLIDHSVMDTTYIEFPKLILENVIIDIKQVSESIHEWSVDNDKLKGAQVHVDSEYFKYRKEAASGVNYLVKEFECKKSADAYSRASVSRTGVLDTTKLHTYKYNEDLFKKITVLPDGKNHGLIFVLDWSGSMQDFILDTVKQLLNLVWFCKKVNIPFETYAFTYEYADKHFDYSDDGSEIQELENNTLYLARSFRMLNLLSHKRSAKDLDKDCRNLFSMAFYHQKRCWDYVAPGFGLSGTPLNESLITLRELIPNFIKENNLQKVNAVILTDGESAGIARVNKTKKYNSNDDYWGRAHLNPSCQIRDRKIGRVYRPAYNEHTWTGSVTKILLENLKDNFPEVNLIGIRVLPSRDVRNFFYNYAYEYSDQMKKRWSKERFWEIKDNGYSALYAIASTTLNESDEFEVSDDATKAQIRTAFKKSLKAKSTNKKVLSSFISMVA